MPEGESIRSKNKVPYNLFHKRYKDTRHQIVPLHVKVHPEAESNNAMEVYDNDNSIAECFIRPLVGKRKNLPFFIGSRMANIAAVYHALLSTCCINGLSALEYLKNFFREVVNGCRIMRICFPWRSDSVQTNIKNCV